MLKRIIVEGVDGSGKTELTRMINERLVLPVVPGFKKSGELSYDKWLLNQMIVDYGGVPVHDRFFYSEVVYGIVLRGQVGIEPKLYTKVLDEIRDNALLIYCRPPYSTIQRTVQVNPQMEGVTDNLQKLYTEYELVMQDEAEIYGSRFLLWDFTRFHWINYVNPVIRRYLGG